MPRKQPIQPTSRSSRTPSQSLAHRLRQKWGIEKTPAECRERLAKSITLLRGMMMNNGNVLPPWDFNAMQVIALVNQGGRLFTLRMPDGKTRLSAWEDGRDWEYESGTL